MNYDSFLRSFVGRCQLRAGSDRRLRGCTVARMHSFLLGPATRCLLTCCYLFTCALVCVLTRGLLLGLVGLLCRQKNGYSEYAMSRPSPR